eukprot:275142-Chlamydomonas_euryale.AAC.1
MSESRKRKTLPEQHEELIDDAVFCRVCSNNNSKAARCASAAAAALHDGQPSTSKATRSPANRMLLR